MDGASANGVIQLEASLLKGQAIALPTLHGILYDCGGWILSHDYRQPHVASLLFEFPRDVCVEIYSGLVSAGLDLAVPSHHTLTELCRCTPYLFDLSSRTVKAVDEASLDDSTMYICSLEIVQVNLTIRLVQQAAPGAKGANAA